jgi:Na+/melibiose symporter-like transporter
VTEVAYYAWGAEITKDYVERGKVATVQQWVAIAGQVAFFGLPLLPFSPTREISFDTLGLLAWGIGCATPLILVFAWTSAPRGNPGSGDEAPTLVALIKAIIANKPMQILILGGMFFDIAASVAVGVGYLFIDSYLQAGNAVPYQGLLQMGGAFVGVSLTGWLIAKYQKHRVWALSTFAYALVMLTALALTPDTPHAGIIYVVITTLSYLLIMGAVVTPMSIIGDVVDYERWRSGEQLSGQFVAAFQLTQKLVGGIAVAGGFYLLSAFGFEAGEDSYDGVATAGIKIVAVIMPALLMALGGFIAWRFPLDRRRQNIVRKSLLRRDTRDAKNRAAQNPSS